MNEEPVSMYGMNPLGKKINIGGTELRIDDEFVAATLLAIVAVLNTTNQGIDEQISLVGQKIYDEIIKTN